MALDGNELIRLLLYGFWLPFGVILILFVLFRVYERIEARRREYFNARRPDMSEEIPYLIRKSEHDIAQLRELVQNQSSFTEKYLESAVERLSSGSSRRIRTEIRDAVKEVTSSVLNEIKSEVKTSEIENVSNDSLSFEGRQSLIREISHALYTPLSRIDAIATNVLATKPGAEISEKMNKAKSAVDICNTYLTAYRNLIHISDKSPYWRPDSLKEAIAASAAVYADQLEKNLDIKVIAPDVTERVSNVYLLALLLPIIENAIEASANNDSISICVTAEEGNLRGDVSNRIHAQFPGDDVFRPGFTTKEGGHDGLGLTIVLSLLSAFSGGSVVYQIDDNSVMFSIRLPAATE
jgi:signal transduction histidine kinase